MNTTAEQNLFSLMENKPIEVEITISKPNIIQKVFGITNKIYTIKPLVLNDYIKIANILDNCKELIEQTDEDNILLNSISTIAKYKNEIVEMISIFFNEKKSFIEKNLDIVTLQRAIVKIVEFNNFSQFFFTLILARQQMTLRTTNNSEK